MIFSDYTEESMENFDAVLANYGVERADGIVIEGRRTALCNADAVLY